MSYRWSAIRQKGYYIPSSQLTDKMWHLEPPEVMSVYYKIQKVGIPISQWPVRIKTGIRLRKYASEIVTTSQEGTEWVGIIKGRDIQKYFHKQPSMWLPRSVMPAISNLDNKYRIIFSKMNAKTGFVLAEPYIYGDETTYILELVDYNEEVLYYLLGILNSCFFDWCFRKFYAGGGLESEVKLFAFKQFPIPKIDANRSLSEKIIEMTKLIYKTGSLEYIKYIENLISELYGLRDKY
jgi:hypothetical protein